MRLNVISTCTHSQKGVNCTSSLKDALATIVVTADEKKASQQRATVSMTVVESNA